VAGFTGLLSATSRRSLDEARREDVEAWIGALLARWKPATARNRYRGLHAFYRWLEDEEDIPSPMAKMKPPVVPDPLGQLINLEREDLELDPKWRAHLRARTVVAPE
jgi:site-specific recombinase XerD